MRTLSRTAAILVTGTVWLSACQILGPDYDETTRTLPGAFPLPVVSMADALRAPSIPDSVNIRAYVISINECPPGALCIIADGVTVAEFLATSPAQEFLHLALDRPSQLRISNRYLLSLEAVSAPGDDGAPRFLRLIGYDRLN